MLESTLTRPTQVADMIEAPLRELPLPHHQSLLLLVLASACLIIAIKFMKRAVRPFGAVVESIAATAAVFLTLGLALALVVAAALST
ncbi:hypothetical protein [Actinoplanes sp. NBRC 101535]|uniref:hypothetical protein n=1 Tax=Actinoplanes sp. NBRC 101535 TaxID=3032196 RepID=UPI0024A08B3B|nr:hypothetical protein [Actinoplanes sp. NBRC 101535]GLY02485.1 hypothetical protein Acsp01_28640 [Actinoplanes sp. NBRC 101535]